VIHIDVDAGLLEVEISDEEIAQRLAERPPAKRHYRRGYGAIYLDNVEQAHLGADFGVLRAIDGEQPPDLPLGLIEGWVLGD